MYVWLKFSALPRACVCNGRLQPHTSPRQTRAADKSQCAIFAFGKGPLFLIQLFLRRRQALSDEISALRARLKRNNSACFTNPKFALPCGKLNSPKGEPEEARRKKKSAPGEIRLFAGREVRLFNREEKYGRSGGRRRAFVRQKQGCACSAGGEYVCLPWEEKDEVAHRKSERRLLKGTFCACGCPAERKERLLRARRFSWGRTAFSSPGTLSWCGRLRASPRMRSEPGGISCALQLSRQPTDVRASGFPQAFLRLVFRRFQSRFKSAPKGGF